MVNVGYGLDEPSPLLPLLLFSPNLCKFHRSSSNKEIKMQDIKTFLIGLLTCDCMFLIMGWGNMGFNQNGRYPGFADSDEIFLVDTVTGKTWGNSVGDTWMSNIKPLTAKSSLPE